MKTKTNKKIKLNKKYYSSLQDKIYETQDYITNGDFYISKNFVDYSKLNVVDINNYFMEDMNALLNSFAQDRDVKTPILVISTLSKRVVNLEDFKFDETVNVYRSNNKTYPCYTTYPPTDYKDKETINYDVQFGLNVLYYQLLEKLVKQFNIVIEEVIELEYKSSAIILDDNHKIIYYRLYDTDNNFIGAIMGTVKRL